MLYLSFPYSLVSRSLKRNHLFVFKKGNIYIPKMIKSSRQVICSRELGWHLPLSVMWQNAGAATGWQSAGQLWALEWEIEHIWMPSREIDTVSCAGKAPKVPLYFKKVPRSQKKNNRDHKTRMETRACHRRMISLEIDHVNFHDPF